MGSAKHGEMPLPLLSAYTNYEARQQAEINGSDGAERDAPESGKERHDDVTKAGDHKSQQRRPACKHALSILLRSRPLSLEMRLNSPGRPQALAVFQYRAVPYTHITLLAGFTNHANDHNKRRIQ